MKKTQRGFGDIKLIGIGVFILVLIVAGGYAYHRRSGSSSNSNTSISVGWSLYKSDKYGFEFSYPNDWGGPTTTEVSNSASKQYVVAFPTDSTKSIKIEMDSGLSNNKDCDPGKGCTTGEVSKAYIESRLKNDKSDLAASDTTSFANVVSVPKQVSGLSVYRIVSVPKIKTDAARLSYVVTSAGVSCPQNGFAPTSTEGCVTKDTYVVADQVIKSLQSL